MSPRLIHGSLLKEIDEQLKSAERGQAKTRKGVDGGRTHDTHLAYADGLVAGLTAAQQLVRAAEAITPRAMTLQFKPALTQSVWVDTYLSDSDGCDLPESELITRLRQGVIDGEWVAWRLMRVLQEEMGVVTT